MWRQTNLQVYCVVFKFTSDLITNMNLGTCNITMNVYRQRWTLVFHKQSVDLLPEPFCCILTAELLQNTQALKCVVLIR